MCGLGTIKEGVGSTASGQFDNDDSGYCNKGSWPAKWWNLRKAIILLICALLGSIYACMHVKETLTYFLAFNSALTCI